MDPRWTSSTASQMASKPTFHVIMKAILEIYSQADLIFDMLSAKILAHAIRLCATIATNQSDTTIGSYHISLVNIFSKFEPHHLRNQSQSALMPEQDSGQPDATPLTSVIKQKDLMDACPMCKAQLQSPLVQRCPNGHPISRCSLTFLPISQPQASKCCSNCRREYINEHHPTMFIEATPNYDDGAPEQRLRMSYAQKLLARFPRCPYCIGKGPWQGFYKA